MVPCMAPLPGFTHIGVNLHLLEDAENGYELASGNDKSTWSQTSFHPLARHSLDNYDKRKSACKDKIGNKTIEEIYNSLNEDQIEIECNRLDELEPALMAMDVFPMVEDLLARIAK